MEHNIAINIPKLIRFLDKGNTFKYSYENQAVDKGLVVVEIKKDKDKPNMIVYGRVKGLIEGETLTIMTVKTNKFDDRKEKDYRRFKRRVIKEVKENPDIEFNVLGDIIDIKEHRGRIMNA